MRVGRVMGMAVIHPAGMDLGVGMGPAVDMTGTAGIGPGLGLEGATFDPHRQSQAP